MCQQISQTFFKCNNVKVDKVMLKAYNEKRGGDDMTDGYKKDELPNSERVQLDEIIKSLFGVSKQPLVKMMNSLFHEQYDVDSVDVSFEQNEFISYNHGYEMIRGDLFLRMIEQDKACHYHIEFQTQNDTGMVLRMFEYGFNKAKELAKYEMHNRKQDETIICIPKQLVIFIEQNKNIKNEITMRIIFPDNQ